MSELPCLGVEEEFHVVDLETRALGPRGRRAAGPARRRGVRPRAAALAGRDEHPGLRHPRRAARAPAVGCAARCESVAEPLGLGVVAAGTVPLVDLDGDDISAGARYERMQHEYQLLVREQHICGAQVHVDVPDRDVAVQVVRRGRARTCPRCWRSRPARRTGGARTPATPATGRMVWSRWPTAGPPGARRDGRRLRRHGRRADRVRHDHRRRDGLLRHPAERAPAHRGAAGVRRLPGRRRRRADRRACSARWSARARADLDAGPAAARQPPRAAARGQLAGGALRAGGRPRRPRSAPRWSRRRC